MFELTENKDNSPIVENPILQLNIVDISKEDIDLNLIEELSIPQDGSISKKESNLSEIIADEEIIIKRITGKSNIYIFSIASIDTDSSEDLYYVNSEESFQELILYIEKSLETNISFSQIKGEINVLENNIKKNKKSSENNGLEVEPNNDELKKTYEEFFSVKNILGLTKEDILYYFEGDYIKAISFLLINRNERAGGVKRKRVKEILRISGDALGKDFIKSRGEWQIRPINMGKDELNQFFRGGSDIYDFLDSSQLLRFHQLKLDFIKNNGLTVNDKISILDDTGLATAFAIKLLKIKEKRMKTLLNKLGIDYDNLGNSSDSIFFKTTLLASAYQLSAGGAIKNSLFTNISFKICEKIGVLEKDDFQKQIRQTIEDERNFVKKLAGKKNISKINNTLRTHSIDLILNWLLENENYIKYGYDKELLEKLKQSGDKHFNNIELRELIVDFMKQLNIDPVSFNIDDYNNGDSKKAIFVGNYGPRAWILLKRKI